MDVFLQLLSYGCCVDIKHYALYNIVSNVVRLDETDISLLLWRHVTVYYASHYGIFLTYIGSKL